MIVDTIDQVVTVPDSLFKFLCTVPQGWKDIQSDLVPAGKIEVLVKAYSTMMQYWVTKKNLLAQIEVGATKMNGKFFKLTVHPGHYSKEQFHLFQQYLRVLVPDMEYAKLPSASTYE
jgi:arginyl-tRNA--protein-N-Asp/Glu arginylyltransferase